ELFAGNYSETAGRRAERRSRPEPSEAASPIAQPTPSPTKPAARSRRADSPEERETAKRKRKIKALEDKIAALEAEVERLEPRLGEEGLHLGPVASRDLSREKATKKEELDKLVEEWASLAELESAERPSS